MKRLAALSLLLSACGGPDYGAPAHPVQPNLILRRYMFADHLAIAVDCRASAPKGNLAQWTCGPYEGSRRDVQGIYWTQELPGFWVTNPEQQITWSWLPRPEKFSWVANGNRVYFEGRGLVAMFILEAVW